MINTAVEETKAKFFTMSNHSEENVMDVRNYACDELLAHRVNSKVKGNKVADVLNRLSVAMPVARDDVKREITIPASVIAARENSNGVAPRVLLKDKMNANGGAGVYSYDFKEHYKGMLRNDDWTQDAIPEIWNGKNIADFVDPDILKRLEALEQEEDEAMANNAPMDEDEEMSDLDDEQQDKLARIREKKAIMVAEHRQNKNKNHATVSRKVRAKLRTLTETKKELEALGVDTSRMKHAEAVVAKRKAGEESRGRKRKREDMDVDMEDATESSDLRVRARAKSQMRSKSKNRSASLVAPRDQSGFGTEADMAAAKRATRFTQRKAAKMGRAGEADRISVPKLAKWQNSGKRGQGNTHSR
ncbi:hypothetical protein ON010_g13417 [Phytophthora cinnamomi]|nr:hypothetical protein ON010_g13417 [Phytophthora cinnamomi]